MAAACFSDASRRNYLIVVSVGEVHPIVMGGARRPGCRLAASNARFERSVKRPLKD